MVNLNFILKFNNIYSHFYKNPFSKKFSALWILIRKFFNKIKKLILKSIFLIFWVYLCLNLKKFFIFGYFYRA